MTRNKKLVNIIKYKSLFEVWYNDKYRLICIKLAKDYDYDSLMKKIQEYIDEETKKK